MKRNILFVFLLFISIFFVGTLVHAEKVYGCNERYLNLVNPVRGRDLWLDKSLKPINEQYQAINSYGFSASWLLQYDTLIDNELIVEIKKFDNRQELGVFLEVSPSLAQDSRVIYPHSVAWCYPNAIFLSGYSQSERKDLINRLFDKFKSNFGHYPKSVGTWWVDSYSLEYMVKKYGVKTAMIVADQRTTDDYGIWGQWWGIPYYPTKANILIPASNSKNIQSVAVIQWAMRDLSRAYGEGPSFSNYSLQANDYLDRGLNTNYFVSLTNRYLNCNLPLGQITVGLETGMESVKFFSEYKNQLRALSIIENLESVTMSEFAGRFSKVYPSNPSQIKLTDNTSTWILTPYERRNEYLSDTIFYNQNFSFSDYFVADKSKFLDRKLPVKVVENTMSNFPWYILVFLTVGFVFWRKKVFKYYIPLSLFTISSYVLVLRSFYRYGWNVYFGTVFSYVEYIKLFVVIVSFTLLYLLIYLLLQRKVKKVNLLMWLLPLTFSIDGLLFILRYSFLEGKHYFGIAVDALRFFGISLSKSGIALINRDFPAVQAGSFLKFPFEDIWNSWFLSFIVYPFVHLLIAFLLWLSLRKLNQKIQIPIIFIMAILFILFLWITFRMDPRIAIPTFK